MSQDTIKIEIDSIDYRFLKASFDRVITHQEQKEKVNKSYLLNECEESDVKVAELVYLGAVYDFIRQIKDTFGILVDTDLSLLVEDAPEAPAESVSEAPAESAPEESESSTDNISSSDVSNNDTSCDDVVNEDANELPFPMDDASYALGLDQRVVVITLSDEDCDRLTEMCGVRKVSVDVMLQNFVRDLVKSKFSNRPEDIINANLWFDNCWFSHYYQPLLGWLVSNGYDPYDDCICYIESIEHGESELLDYEVNPGGFDPEEMEYLKEDIKDWKEHICKIRRQFLSVFADANWSCEFEELEKWYKNRELFKDGTVTFRGRVLNINR